MKKLALAALGLGVIFVASNSIYYVPKGHRMILFHKLKGVMDETFS